MTGPVDRGRRWAAEHRRVRDAVRAELERLDDRARDPDPGDDDEEDE